MKKKGVITTLVIAAISSLMIFTGCKHPRSHGSFALDYLVEVLDLEQQLEDIREELITAVEKVHENKEDIVSALKVELVADTMDKTVLRQLVDTHRDNMDDVINLAIERLTEFHSTLNQQQKEKLVAKLEKMEKYHHCGRFRK